MRAAQMILGLGFLGLMVACEPNPAGVEIDEMEVQVEEECLKILALHQPVAVDLRLVVAILKINNDLERIADEAVNIAQRIQTMVKDQPDRTVFDYEPMASQVERMLQLSLDALVNMDVDMAFRVVTMDDAVDGSVRAVPAWPPPPAPPAESPTTAPAHARTTVAVP